LFFELIIIKKGGGKWPVETLATYQSKNDKGANSISL